MGKRNIDFVWAVYENTPLRKKDWGSCASDLLTLANPLGPAAQRAHAVVVHVEEAVLGGDEALGEERVILRGSLDVCGGISRAVQRSRQGLPGAEQGVGVGSGKAEGAARGAVAHGGRRKNRGR